MRFVRKCLSEYFLQKLFLVIGYTFVLLLLFLLLLLLLLLVLVVVVVVVGGGGGGGGGCGVSAFNCQLLSNTIIMY